MKKLFPYGNKTLIYAALLVLVAAAAAVIAFKLYPGPGTMQESKPSQPVPAAAQRKPAAPVPGQVKAGQPGMAEPKKPEAAPAAASPGAAQLTVVPAPFEYNALGRRDPFTSLIVQEETEKRKGAPPIESYDVADFKLSAILWNKTGFYALVSSPDGKNFTLREGTAIGLHNGKVYKITTDSVIIREFLKDYRGTVRPHDFVFKLHRGEEE